MRGCCRLTPLIRTAVFAVAAAQFRTSWRQLELLQASLGAASSTWQPGQAFVLRLEWLPMLDQLNRAFDQYCKLEQAGFACFCGLLIAVRCGVARSI